MSILSDYKRLVEEPHLRDLHGRINALRARAEAAEARAERLEQVLREARQHIDDDDDSGAYLILKASTEGASARNPERTEA